MSRNSGAAGFDIRRAAAQRLQLVLTGAPFVPFGVQDISDARDRALANRLVTVSLRRHGQINQILNSVLEKGMPRRAGLFEAAMRIGIAQLLFLPEMGEHSAIHLAVEVIKKDRRAGRFAKLANAMLRNVQRGFNARDLNLDDLIPGWMHKRWCTHYGAQAAQKMAGALIAGAALDLTAKNVQQDAERFENMGARPILGQSFRLNERDVPVENLPGFSEGEWWVQDFAATLPVQLAHVQDGEYILDICAAPGGKTAQLAAHGANVTAVDIDGKRLARVKQNLDRLGLSAKLVEADATNLSTEIQYDHVILDAPCSATGTFRRHPEVIWHRREKDIDQRSALQTQMLQNAARLVKVGGQLVFCTCSLEPEEGEMIAQAFLASHTNFNLKPIQREELDGWSDVILDHGFLRTLPGMKIPNNEGDLDGFFAARFIRGE